MSFNKDKVIIDQAQKNKFEGIDITLIEKLSKVSAKNR